MGIVIASLLVIIIVILLNMNSKLPKADRPDPVKEAMERDRLRRLQEEEAAGQQD
ncbi:hypothetical protein [Paenibacillus radicis (ex Gao et al. 2016)]|uniref:Uncharacterized protein n=1 Tax=Paenibacillus radicis (ex Gao et al. 2016) TaxID=1737354 RepID=A0A917M1Q7_9BACL|nr:hypothetical protein [Paenibacillus radicis (ex Gao et al. 2016)]GGG71159.1 hypothetical protein GCM10010918_28300 [Paenibacillus radicis (ex Gao et al. 2016)]